MVKNLLELKNARNVQIDGNLIENNWQRDQNGFAVLFTPRASGAAPWTTIEPSVSRTTSCGTRARRSTSSATTVRRRPGSCAASSSATTCSPTSAAAAWGGAGIFLQIGDEAADVHVEHNTVMQTGLVVSVYGGTPDRAARVQGLSLRQQRRPAQRLRHLRQRRRHRQPGDRHLLAGQRDRGQRPGRRQREPSTRPATCSRRSRP